MAAVAFDLEAPVLWRSVRFDGMHWRVAHSAMEGIVVLSDRQLAVPPRMFCRNEFADGSVVLDLGIEVTANGTVACTYVGLTAGSDEVRAKYLKPIRIEDWVSQLVAGMAFEGEISDSGAQFAAGPTTREQVRAVEARQRRRQDPRTDQQLLTLVADIYRRNLDTPYKAIAARFGVSERTAGRWAKFASEAGLLPKARQGVKRL